MLAQIKSEVYKLPLNRIYGCSAVTCVILTIILGLSAQNTVPHIFINQAYPMVDVFYICVCLIVGSIWSLEYSDNTMEYLLIAGKKREQIYLAKYFSAYLSISILHLVCSGLIIIIDLSIHRFGAEHILQLVVPLSLQWALLLALSGIFMFAAVLLRKFSYLTIVMIAIYILFRWLLASLANKTIPPFLNKLSYITLQYRILSSIAEADNSILSDCISFCMLFVVPCFLIGYIIFRKQEF